MGAYELQPVMRPYKLRKRNGRAWGHGGGSGRSRNVPLTTNLHTTLSIIIWADNMKGAAVMVSALIVGAVVLFLFR